MGHSKNPEQGPRASESLAGPGHGLSGISGVGAVDSLQPDLPALTARPDRQGWPTACRTGYLCGIAALWTGDVFKALLAREACLLIDEDIALGELPMPGV
jgi:hypothetical protein